ncbi:hypothetical protein PUR29_32955 [Methylobacterium ajmalii]|uniref:Uncharacterized protein n=1 Tax=Methylobacterium ajmalii TaxID=2738439 RepID=A0ABV0A4E4_9HYPH
MTGKWCGTCTWFDPIYVPVDETEEAVGLCEWPAERLPHSLRWGNRERLAVGPLEGENCPCHELKPEGRADG